MGRLALLSAALLLVGCDGGGGAPPLADLGEPCEEHGDCASGLCLGEPGASTCARPCADEDECGPAEACRLLLVTREEAAAVESACLLELDAEGLLFDPCEADEGCRSGLCVDGLCTELCESCGREAACEAAAVRRFDRPVSIRRCLWRVGQPELALGPLPVSETGSEEIEVPIPGGLASFTIILRREASDEVRVGFLSLVAPDGTVLTDFEAFGAELNPAAVPYPGASSVLVPSTDHEVTAPQEGSYLLRAGLWDIVDDGFAPVAGVIDEVLVVVEPEGEQGGHLDVSLFLAPGTGLTAATAATSDFVVAMLSTLEGTFASGGMVRLGDVRFEDLDAEADVVDSGEEARALVAARSEPGPRGGAVNVFLVRDIAFPGTDAAGYTAGAPGPVGLVGTPASGIVLETQEGGGRTGTVLAHELGHFLGLRHTTLFRYLSDGTYDILGEDGVSDTPHCEPGMAVRDCPDYHNLMFAFFPFDGLSLTAGQIQVVAGSPLLYELHRPDRCEEGGGAYDLTWVGAGSGDTARLGDRLRPSCGGAGAPDRTHLYRLRTEGLAALDVRVVGRGFAPVVAVRRGGCGPAAAEVACAAAEAEGEALATVVGPEPGDYYVVVDGTDAAGGPFAIEVTERAE